MAVTRKFLKDLGLTDEQTESIIEAHTEVTDALKAQITDLQAKADRADDVQKQLDALKSGKDWKAEHDRVQRELDDYRKEVAGKEKLANIKAAYRKLLADKNVGEKFRDSVMGVTDFSKMELEKDGTLKDVEALTKDIESKWSGFIATVNTQGANVENPPKNPNPSGANSRAAELARRYHEMRYGKAAEAAKND